MLTNSDVHMYIYFKLSLKQIRSTSKITLQEAEFSTYEQFATLVDTVRLATF